MNEPDIFPQQLQSQFRGRIDEQVALWSTNEYRAAVALVAGIGRTAHPAVAADHRDADGCARAEEGKRTRSRHPRIVAIGRRARSARARRVISHTLPADLRAF